MKTTPVPGVTYQHHTNQSFYVIDKVLPFKLDGVWIPNGAVVYSNIDDGHSYVRLTDDFMESFQLVSEPSPFESSQ